MKKASIILAIMLAFGLAAGNCPASEDTGIDIHGFISQGYLQSSDNNFHAPTADGTFEFNEFGINFSKDLTDKMRAGVQLFARDLGTLGNDEVTIDWAYGDYRWKDWLGFRAGKIKTPQGLYNETRDVDALRNWVFLPQSVYAEVLRDTTLSLIGGGIYGNIDLNTAGFLSYQAAVGTQNIDGDPKLFNSLLGAAGNNNVVDVTIDVERKYSLGLLWETPLDGLRLGGTWNRTKMDMAGTVLDFQVGPFPPMDVLFSGDYKKFETTVLSVEYTWNDLLLVGEYMKSHREVTFYAAGGSMALEYKPDGWYLGTAYRFNDWFELGGYYSEYYADRNDRDGEDATPFYKGYLKDLSLTARFDIDAYWTIKVEGHSYDGTATLSHVDNLVPTDGSDQWEEGWHMFAAKATFSF